MKKRINKRKTGKYLDLSLGTKYNPYAKKFEGGGNIAPSLHKVSAKSQSILSNAAKNSVTGGKTNLDREMTSYVNNRVSSGDSLGSFSAENRGPDAGNIAAAALGTAQAGLSGFMDSSQIKDTSALHNEIEDYSNTDFTGASDFDSLIDMGAGINPLDTDYSQGDFTQSTGQQVGNVLKSTASGAMAGLAAGPWGALAGAVVGLGAGIGGIFAGNKKAKQEAARLNEEARMANQRVQTAFTQQSMDLIDDQANNIAASIAAYGGPLNRYWLDNNLDMDYTNYAADGGKIYIKPSKRGTFTAAAKKHGMGVQEFARKVLANKDNYSPAMVKKANFARNAAGWKHDLGGYLFAHGGDWTNGVSTIDTGGTHESNPYDGVPMGVAPDGQPNLVEQGEVIYNDYVFSNRLHPTQKDLLSVNLPKYYKNSTFAYIAERMSKESSERPNDPISKRSLEDSLEKLASIQEAQRARKGKKGTQQMMAFGGRKSPEIQEGLKNIRGENQKSNILPTYLRYAPVLGSALGALHSVFQKPDYTNSDILMSQANNLSRRGVTARTLGNYLTYRPLDRNYYLNQLKGQAGATRRAIQNAGGNAGSIMAGLLAADYNAQNAVGNALMQMDQYNNAQRQQVAQFNRGTDQYNSQALMTADAQNAQLAANRDRLRSQLLTTAAGMREQSDAQLEAIRSASLTNMFDNLGDIGKENMGWNWTKYLANSGAFGTLREGVPMPGQSKNGGLLTKRRRRRE